VNLTFIGPSPERTRRPGRFVRSRSSSLGTHLYFEADWPDGEYEVLTGGAGSLIFLKHGPRPGEMRTHISRREKIYYSDLFKVLKIGG